MPLNKAEDIVHRLRSRLIILDADLANILGIPTHRLNEIVKRNLSLFSEKSMFNLSLEELNDLRTKYGSSRWTKRRSLPRAFSKEAALVAAKLLGRDEAIILSKIGLSI